MTTLIAMEQLAEDVVGRRFEAHYTRLRDASLPVVAARIGAGALLVLVGVILLFIPGPGTLVIVGGLALIAGHSLRLARFFDRCEPKLRAWWGRMRARFARR